jgi:prevent-host-death family protein
MTKFMSVSEIKAHLSDALRAVEARRERIVVERRGRPVAVLQPFASAEDAQTHWAEALDGLAAEIDDFETILDETVASRARSTPRPIDLDD